MDLTEAVLVRKRDPERDRVAAIRAFHDAMLKLMKSKEVVYAEKGLPFQLRKLTSGIAE
jgi:hypothetical protein